MADDAQNRKLATILSLDMAGYSAQSERNQERAIAYVAALRARASALATEAGGHIFNTAGDGLMLEFPLASGAVRTAVTLAQEAVADPEKLPRLRAGIHLGEVIIDGHDRLGHGVNVAARLMQMAPPNGVVVSDVVHSQLRGEIDANFEPCGRVRLKKMQEKILAFEYLPQASPLFRIWRRWRTHALSAGAALLLLVLLGAGYRLLSWAPAETPSIAVLPFENLTGDAHLDYFPQGLATEIQSELAAHLQAATVFGRTTGFQFRTASDKSPSNVRRMIGATHVVDGAIRRDGSSVRVDVEFIDARNGASLWQASYQQPFDDGLAMQADIARKVARELHVVEPEIAAPPVSGTALAHFLRAVSLLDQISDSVPDLNAAASDLEAATRLAPNFARAWALLSRTYSLQSRRRNAAEQAALIVQARDAASKALALDPKSGLAEAMLGRAGPEWNWDHRQTHFLRALALAPNDLEVLGFWSDLLVKTGRIQEAKQIDERMLRLDPLSQGAQSTLVGHLLSAGNYAGAMRAVERMQAQNPKAVVLWMVLLNDRENANDLSGARHALGELEKQWAAITEDKAWSREQSEHQLAEFRNDLKLLERGPPNEDVYRLAGKSTYERVTGPNMGQGCVADNIPVVASNSQPDLAWKMIETLYIDRGYVGTIDTCGRAVYPAREAATWPLFTDELADLRRDPRIWRTFDAVGLTRYWRESGHWPDLCSDPKLPYDCRKMAAAKR